MFEQYVQYPWVLLTIPPLFFLMILIGFKNKGLALLKFIIITLLIIALAGPYNPEHIFSGGDKKLIILADESRSFELFDQTTPTVVQERIEQALKATTKTFGDEHNSFIGDMIIENLEEDGNILLISDGNNNGGTTDLGDALLKAKEYNASIHAIDLDMKEQDRHVTVFGPQKVSAEVKNIFNVFVKGTDATPQRTIVRVDGKTVMDEVGTTFEFEQKWDSGFHQIEAEIFTDDYFKTNNKYYKSVKVVDKPPVLYVGEGGNPLASILNALYDTSQGGVYTLDKYYAVVLDNIPYEKLASDTKTLQDFVEKGNGLVIFGGKQSFDYGNYKGTDFEDLTPVFVSGAERKEGNVNIILAIDVSRSTNEQKILDQTGKEITVKIDTLTLAKSLASGVLQGLSTEHNVGVIAFDTEAYMISELSNYGDKDLAKLNEDLSKITAGGYGTHVGVGLATALNMLSGASGSKNIIFISDGLTQEKDQAYAVAEQLASKGIPIYAIGVGNNPDPRYMDENFLKNIAATTNGEYFKAAFSNKIRLLFGDPDNAPKPDIYTLNVEDKNHFITENLILSGTVNGFNAVIPKSTAQLLITTSSGEPLVTAWRIGLGRVVVVSTDNGKAWGNDVYSPLNSEVISRIVNWAVGDPERKEQYIILADDGYLGKEMQVMITSSTQPSIKGYEFKKTSTDTYTAVFTPQQQGFFTIGDSTYAVNENPEVFATGMNDELELIAFKSGGVFVKKHETEDLLQALRTQNNLVQEDKELFQWPFILTALSIFIVSVWFRKLNEHKGI